MKVLHITHDSQVDLKEIPDPGDPARMDAMQDLVGGMYECCTLYRFLGDPDMFLNEEGAFNDKPNPLATLVMRQYAPNTALSGDDTAFGDVFITAGDEYTFEGIVQAVREIQLHLATEDALS